MLSSHIFIPSEYSSCSAVTSLYPSEYSSCSKIFVVRSNDSFNFQLGLTKYIVIVNNVCLQLLSYTLHTLRVCKTVKNRSSTILYIDKIYLERDCSFKRERERADWQPVEVNVLKSESKCMGAIYCTVSRFH